MMMILTPKFLILDLVASVLDLQLTSLALPAVMGSIAITLYQYKKGDSIANALGKLLIGFTVGYWLGGFIAKKTGLEAEASSAFGGLLSPSILATLQSRVSSWVGLPDKIVGKPEDKPK